MLHVQFGERDGDLRQIGEPCVVHVSHAATAFPQFVAAGMLMNPDGSRVERLTTTEQGRGSWQPVWSPGQVKIAFASNRDGNRELYTMNADGSGVQRLTHTMARERTPAWSPDGKKLVFASDRDGDSGIYVMNVDGSDVRLIAQFEKVNVTRPDWSPDGRQILFSASIQWPDGEWEEDIYLMNADGSNIRRLTRHAAVNYQAVWSPDGGRIVFDST